MLAFLLAFRPGAHLAWSLSVAIGWNQSSNFCNLSLESIFPFPPTVTSEFWLSLSISRKSTAIFLTDIGCPKLPLGIKPAPFSQNTVLGSWLKIESKLLGSSICPSLLSTSQPSHLLPAQHILYLQVICITCCSLSLLYLFLPLCLCFCFPSLFRSLPTPTVLCSCLYYDTSKLLSHIHF